ncbi:hypothetical protein JOQ06_015488 [Pogonophryne albipinna]|uniref:Uncharacterized protein n=1 Tax=Pogonophryne albipinna TaxID=1090488 RepID=A0AAD6ANX5_9TELE|nr:hypothetical protein JOQ06_015488 [Pogonophryne albipinna]
MERLSESQHVTIVITEKAPACCQLLRDPDLPKIASARPAERGSPLDPSCSRGVCVCASEFGEGRCAAAEVIPEFKSAEVLRAPEQCVTASSRARVPRVSTPRRK